MAPYVHDPEGEAKYMKTHYTFVTWKWKQEGFRSIYSADHVNVMQQMIDKNVKAPHRVICVTDESDNIKCDTYPLWNDASDLKNASGHHLPSCYRRLKLFDCATQESLGIPRGSRIVSIDLDAVILDDMMPLLKKQEMFVGWGVPGSRHNMVFNGSMWMFTADEELQWMWTCFNPIESPKRALAAGFFGSDQSYLSHQLSYTQIVGKWTDQDGVLSYMRNVRATRVLPKHARVVMFHGKRKPWDPNVRRESRWIERYWKYEPQAV